MIESYNDKKYLAQYDLCTELFDRFDIKVYDVVPVRSVFILYTNKGEKILKRANYTKEEIEFIDSALSYIKKKFSRVMEFVKTKDGKVYTIWGKDMYCIMDLLEGRECDYCNPVDIAIASKALGELHKASEGFKANLQRKKISGKLIDNFKRRNQEMGFFKSIANMHENKNEFDTLFLDNVDYYIKQIEKSIEILESSQYLRLCGEEEKVVLCHHDLAHHNILIKDEEAYFVDFDYAVIDIKVHDLCNFTNKVVKNFAFDLDKMDIILNNYCSKNMLDEREMQVLYGMLTFPEDFYSISRDYYTRRKEWEEDVFLERLIRKVNYKNDREDFLNNIYKKLKTES